MKTARTYVHLSMILCIVVSSRLFAQGYYWESTISGGPVGEHATKNYMMPKLFKMVQDGPQQHIIITDLGKRVIITVHDADRTYSEISFDSLEARMKTIGGASDAKMEELRAKMKDMPEEQRKMIEKMMGPMAGGSGTVEVKKSTEKKTIAGHACMKFEIMQGEKTLMTVWATKDLKGFDKLRGDWEAFSKQMTSQIPGQLGKSMAAGMEQIAGFPMETEIGPVTSTVTKIEQRSTPASAFAVPSGFKKIDEPMFEPKSK